jgi:hypothetical protein
VLILLLSITCFNFGVLGFFTQPLSGTMNRIHCYRAWKHFSFSGHTGGVVSTHFGPLETANLNHWT